MLVKPEISLIASAVRPHCWLELYESLRCNDVPFEIIFVGSKEPEFTLPDNFKFILSPTKPAQCVEIASRNATADLIMHIGDDCELKLRKEDGSLTNEHTLDTMYKMYNSIGNEKLILSCRYMQNGVDRSESDHYFFCENPVPPIIPLAGLMSRKLYRYIGGIDRIFIAAFYDVDVAMRVYAFGGTVIMSDVYLSEDKSKNKETNLCAEFGGPDRGFLEYLWSVNKKVHFNRNRWFEPFSDYRIVEETQGPRGKW